MCKTTLKILWKWIWNSDEKGNFIAKYISSDFAAEDIGIQKKLTIVKETEKVIKKPPGSFSFRRRKGRTIKTGPKFTTPLQSTEKT